MKKILLSLFLFFLATPVSTFAQAIFDQRSGISPAYGSSNQDYFNIVEGYDNRLYLPYFDFNENRFSYIANEYQFYYENNDNRSNRLYTLPRISTSGTDTLFVINSWVEYGKSKLQINKFFDISDGGSHFNQQRDRLYQSDNDFDYNGSSISGDGKYIISGGVRYTLDDELNITFSDSLVPSMLPYIDDYNFFEFRGNFATHQMNYDGSRYSVIKTFPKDLNSQNDSLITKFWYFAYEKTNQIWHGAFINIEYSSKDLFVPTFDHSNGSLYILNSEGLHEFNVKSRLDEVVSDAPETSILLSLSNAFNSSSILYSDLNAITYSGDQSVKFELTREGKIIVSGLNTASMEYEHIKEFWGQEYPYAAEVGYLNPVSLKTNSDGSLLNLSSMETGEWIINEPNYYYRNEAYNIDNSKPYIESFVDTDNPLVFEVIFNEEVYHVESESFYATLNGVEDENKLSVRSVNQMDNESFEISFRTNSGEVSGDIAIGINDSSKIVDRYQNPAADSTVTPISVQNFDALASKIVIPDNFSDLSEAIRYSGNSDTLLLNEGIYDFGYSSIREKHVVITSTFDPSFNNQEAVLNTIVKGYLVIEESNVSISGITIDGGRIFAGGGGYNEDYSMTSFNLSYSNILNSDEPISVSGNHINITNNLFHQNRRSALTIYNGTSGTLADNIFVFNSKGDDENSTIVVDDSDIHILHNLIAYNKSRKGGGILLERSFSSLINNIIWGNEAFRGDQLYQGEGLPFIDHSIVQNYGQGANVLAREGDNVYTEDPGLEISYEPITASKGKSVINRFGLYVSISDSSMIFGNGRSTDFDKYAMQTRVPVPFDSDADIGPFELEFAMVVNPIKATQLVFPIESDENPGVDPLFEWEPIKYSTAYEMMISSKKDFSENVSTHKSDRHFMSLDNPLDSSHEKYYWKVRGINATKKGIWSQVHMFNVGIINSNELLEEITEYQLSQNYPNPFNPSTQIQYALPEATEVTLEVFNSVGQKVMELVNGQQSAGYHTATFDASGLSSGVYLYKLTTPSFTQTKKMLLIK